MKHKKTATLLVIEGNPTYAHHWWSKNKHQLFYLPPHSFLYENAQNNGISQNIESFLLSGLPNSPQQGATNNTYDHGALVLSDIKTAPLKRLIMSELFIHIHRSQKITIVFHRMKPILYRFTKKH